MQPDRPSRLSPTPHPHAARHGHKAHGKLKDAAEVTLFDLSPDNKPGINRDPDTRGHNHTDFFTNPEHVSEATHWRPGSTGMSGADANELITRYYSFVDSQMDTYLGQPTVANWATFAKYASRQAGEQIHQLEAFLNVAHGHSPASALALCSEFLAHPGPLSEQMKLLWERSGTPGKFIDNIQHMRDVLVAGNTGILRDMVPAFRVFLTAENGGSDGIKALERNGYGKAPRDPQGFLLETFKHFQAAHRLDDEIKRHPLHSPEAQKLLDERRHHVAAANLRLGMQEQWVTLQQPKTFGDPVVAELMKDFTPGMTLTDADGTHRLLPNGGNWASFADRMGMVEVDPATLPAEKRDKLYTVSDAQGHKHHYILNPDRKAREGSIFGYFTSDHSTGRAQRLRAGEPRPYDEAYDDPKVGLKEVWSGLKGLLKRD